MSSQISMSKLDDIRHSLVSTRFNAKKEANQKRIAQLIYDLMSKSIPEPIMTLFLKEEEDFINYDPKSDNVYNLCNEPKYFKTISYVHLWSSGDILHSVLDIMNENGANLTIKSVPNISVNLPSPLPCSERVIKQTVLAEVKKKGDLYEALKEYIIRDKEIRILDNKIRCLFSSKRFYPGSLKNDFPEAYEVYVKMFEEKTLKPESKATETTCDSIESIRATLLSNK